MRITNTFPNYDAFRVRNISSLKWRNIYSPDDHNTRKTGAGEAINMNENAFDLRRENAINEINIIEFVCCEIIS